MCIRDSVSSAVVSCVVVSGGVVSGGVVSGGVVSGVVFSSDSYVLDAVSYTHLDVYKRQLYLQSKTMRLSLQSLQQVPAIVTR